jgi:CPA1 family monovalent cation:H+ antiporter
VDLPIILSVLAVLLVVVSLAQPLAGVLRLPYSVLLALIGIVVGAGASFLWYTEMTDAFNDVARAILDFPRRLDGLPLRLPADPPVPDDPHPRHPAAGHRLGARPGARGLRRPGRHPRDRLGPGALHGSAAPGLSPARRHRRHHGPDLGRRDLPRHRSPARLGRLVEGESLLNDAAAITLFSVFLTALLMGQPLSASEATLRFLWTLTGGALVGFVGARLAAWLIGAIPDHRAAKVSLSFALPYLVYIVAEQALGVSGVIGVVAAGVVLNLLGPARASPDGWSYLTGVWDQVAFWASSLVFVLAAILVPRLLADLTWAEVGLILLVAAAALAARMLVLFLLLPLLTAMRVSPPVSTPYRLVILWGGLRGAVTLALALAVTENAALAPT